MRDADVSRLVGNRLRELRENQKLSARQLALRARLSTEMVTRAERGERTPSLETLVRVCDALGVGLAEFFEHAGGKRTPSFVALERALAGLTDAQRGDVMSQFAQLVRLLRGGPGGAPRRRGRPQRAT